MATRAAKRGKIISEYHGVIAQRKSISRRTANNARKAQFAIAKCGQYYGFNHFRTTWKGCFSQKVIRSKWNAMRGDTSAANPQTKSVGGLGSLFG